MKLIGKYSALSVAAALASMSTPVLAQTDQAGVEKIRVTGSYVRGSETSEANPVSVFDTSDIKNLGAADVSEIIAQISVSSGAENRPDTFTSFYSQGTSNVNLRGLGLSSTLVLINGKRQTISGAKAQDGSVFVDTGSIPAIALQQIDILKEGAAATYGSDAVAGVVNFTTRKSFDGVRVEGSWQTTTDDSQIDRNLSILGGFDIGNDTHIVLAGTVLRRGALNSRERPDLVNRAFSSLGSSFSVSEDVVVADGPYAGSYVAGENVAAPNCSAFGGTLAAQPNGERCTYQYGVHYNVVNEEEREQVYASLNSEFSDMTLTVTGMYTQYDVIDNPTPPSFPNLTFPTISGDHPDNPFGVDVTYLGRPYPFLSRESSLPAPRENDTFRLEAELSGVVADYDWKTSIAYSANDYSITQPDLSPTLLDLAIAGFGGESGNLRYNPFDPLDEDNLLIQDWAATAFSSETSTSLIVWDGVISGDLMDLSAGTASFAVGAQIRHESYEVKPDDVSEIVIDENGVQLPNDFLFLGGVNAVDESRNSYAIFAEAEFPLADGLDLNTAVRYEELDTASSFDPKIALRYKLTDGLLLRASASTSFREPSLAQFYAKNVNTRGIQDFVLDANGDFVRDENGQIIPRGSTLFVRETQNGSLELSPEEATNYNFGVVWNGDRLQTRLDYWRVDYEDVITIEDANGKLQSDPDGVDIIRLDPSDPTSELTGVITNYFNAETIDASGVDFEASYQWQLGNGDLELKTSVAHILEYEIPLNGVTTDVSGLFNHNNFARSMPETKGNISVQWKNDQHSIYARLNFVSSYENTRVVPESTGLTTHIESYAPVDIQYRYNMEIGEGLAEFTLGVINVFDEDPPEVYDAANFSYDPKHHDPRGRLIYARAAYTF
ncbi:TonB-dependent receptor domain-containing protein [Alteromonas sp. a30]|uniref:TonB-dependent receptor domain-containing protein n=1 Tax=Alteromonas sp. a30 TaxID=2730917 RepID=UPI002282654A|nr:TonB-dependent receptor [Alteromonas sp. a30]MCY7297368.1 TonB-dependent receptor [Alteromonas sp. a30]